MQRARNLLYFLTIVKLILPFFLQHSFYQPHRDEFLYLAEGHHPAFGYMEVPPLLSIFAWLTNAFGGSMFWIKIWPVLFGAMTFFLVGKMILSLGGRGFALLMGFLPFVADGYIRLFFLFQPNFLEVFFWTAIAFCLFQFIQTQNNKWFYYMGACIGLGMMSKYSVAFYTFSLLTGLLFTRHRYVFAQRHIYLGVAIAVIIFLPNLVWQAVHHFAVFKHMQELQETQLKFIRPSDFLISQMMMNLPCIFTWIAGLLFCVFNRKGSPYRVFGIAYFFVIVILVVLHGKDYYALGAYPVLFAFGAVALERATSYRRKFLRIAMLAFSIVLGLIAMPLLMPVAKPEQLAAYYQKMKMDKTAAFKWEDLKYHPLPQDFADMIRWKELTEKAAAVYAQIPAAQKDSTLVYCRGYFSAGALNYYGRKMGLPEVYSDNASFLLWMPLKYHVKNLILVGHQIPDSTDKVFTMFEKKTVKDSMNYPLFRENGMRIILYENARPGINAMIENGIKSKKAEFGY